MRLEKVRNRIQQYKFFLCERVEWGRMSAESQG
jgi:hypothetical protein